MKLGESRGVNSIKKIVSGVAFIIKVLVVLIGFYFSVITLADFLHINLFFAQLINTVLFCVFALYFSDREKKKKIEAERKVQEQQIEYERQIAEKQEQERREREKIARQEEEERQEEREERRKQEKIEQILNRLNKL